MKHNLYRRRMAAISATGDEFPRLRRDGFPYVMIPCAVLRQAEDLGQAAWRILIALWRWFTRWDSCRPTRRAISSVAGVSLDTVDRGLRELQATGYLRAEPDGQGRVTYHKCPKLVELQSPYPDVKRMGARWAADGASACLEAEPESLRARRVRRRRARLARKGRSDLTVSPRGTAGPPRICVPVALLAPPADLRFNAWRMLLGLYAYWQRRGWCSPSHATLAWCVNCGEASVARGIAELKKAGYIRVTPRWNNSNTYRKTDKLLAYELGQEVGETLGEGPLSPEMAALADELTAALVRSVLAAARDAT
jgi:DNA-binding transcriptional MocR family regulator